MKRAALLLLPLLTACNEITEQKQLRLAQVYGQGVLDAYAAQHLGRHLADTKTASFSCGQVMAKPLPKSIMECQVRAWGQQAVAEVSYLANPADTLSWKQVRVGQMRGFASEAELSHFGHKMVQDYRAWTETADFAAWLKTHPFNAATDWGGSQNCHEFSQQPLPAGVISCMQGPGPADGPTIILRLADGRSLNIDVR